MRLIDADELKKCKVYSEERHEYVVAVFNIDNAPTVEPCYQTNSCLDCQMYDKDNHKCPRFCTVIKELVDEERPTGEWIPVTTRDMTEEDAKELLDESDLEDFHKNPESYWQYNCRLPDDGQEVLVSTKWGVSITTFYYDVDYGNYFEEYEDRYDVDAWMPLPEAYEKGAEE